MKENRRDEGREGKEDYEGRRGKGRAVSSLYLLLPRAVHSVTFSC